MRSLLLYLLWASSLTCFADEGAFVSVGAAPEFGLLDGVPFESCAFLPFHNDCRIYLCYRKRVLGDFVVGERVLGLDGPVTESHPGRVITRIVVAMENHLDPSKTRFFELPKETFHEVTNPDLGLEFARGRTRLAIVLQERKLTVFMTGGDGAGFYAVNWAIDMKDKKVRRIDSLREDHRISITGPWFEMREIPSPKITTEEKR